MDYLAIYNSLVTKAKNEQRSKKQGTYYESHHIIPRCMNGTNDKSNLVLLTPKEHYIAHRLLCMIYPENKSIRYAIWYMVNGKKTFKEQRYAPSARIYAKLREAFSIFVSNERKGQKTWNKGIKYDDDRLKDHMTHRPGYEVWNKGKLTGPQSEETRKKKSDKLKGRPRPKDIVDKIKATWLRKSEEIKLSKPVIIKPTKAELSKIRSDRMKANPNRCRIGTIMSPETRKKLSDASKFRPPISEETRNKMKAAHAKRHAKRKEFNKL